MVQRFLELSSLKNLHFKDPVDCYKAIAELKNLVCQNNIMSSSSEDDQPEAVEKNLIYGNIIKI